MKTIKKANRKSAVFVQAPKASISFSSEDANKGFQFENYVVTLFDNKSDRFRLMEWRSDKNATNGVYPYSNHFPDLEFAFRDKYGRHRFAIECKWRSRFHNDKIDWANEKQISNYLFYQREYGIPVFIAIGVGGLPSAPEKLFVTPLRNISSFPEVFENQLMLYNRNPRHRFFFDSVQLKLF